MIFCGIVSCAGCRDRKKNIKESWPKGPSFGMPLKGAVLHKAVQVKSDLKCLKLWCRFALMFLYNWQNSLTLAHF